MHELTVTHYILEIALRHAQQAGARRVTDLFLVIGQLSSVVDDSVQFYWDIISQGTPAEGAKLHFRRVPAELLCLDCERPFNLEDGTLTPCPNCGGMRLRVTAGEEFLLESIQVES